MYFHTRGETEHADINQDDLVSSQKTIRTYPKLTVESKVSQLAIKLARDSFFGDSVLVRCTVMGHGKLPALPNAQLNELKCTVYKLFPQYHQYPLAFEKTWRDCAEAIGQCCKRLRLEGEKKKVINLI